MDSTQADVKGNLTEFSRKQQLEESKAISHFYGTKLTLVNKPVTETNVEALPRLKGKGKMKEVESSLAPTSVSQQDRT